MIPKIASFYWGNKRMSYLRYLTLASFRLQNPNWRMRLIRRDSSIGSTWTSGERFDKAHYTGPDYTERIADLDIELVPWNFPEIDKAFPNLSDIHASDVLTWLTLSTVGGIMSDMDILFIRPVPWSLLSADAGVVCFSTRALNCETRFGYFPVSFLMGCPGNRFFAGCLLRSIATYDPGIYESCGSPVLSATFDSWLYENPKILPDGIVYPFQRQDALSFGGILNSIHVEDARAWMSSDTIGVHWYAGSDLASRHNFAVNHETIRGEQDTLCLLAKEMGF